MIDSRDTLIVVSGCSGAGKSTYVTSFLAANPRFLCVSPDALRLELTGDMSRQDKNGFIFNTLLPIRINGVWAQQMGCVVDSTATTRKSRKLLVEYAKTAGYTRIECHVVWAQFKDCMARNAARERQVPVDVLVRQHAQWQEPELAEGFDTIVQVDTFPLDTLPQPSDTPV